MPKSNASNHNTHSTTLSSHKLEDRNNLHQVKFLTLNEAQVLEFDELLKQALIDIDLDLNEHQVLQLLHYLDKLLTWNKAYNLTAIKQPKEALIKHVFDCLAIVPMLRSGSLLDIGTGAGLPSVIIAICQPHREVTALDSNQKKIRFIRQIISELQIDNVTAVASRIENFEGEFEVITSRAFASLSDFVIVAAPYLQHSGCLQAMKGLAPTQVELEALQEDWQIHIMPVSVPMLADSRHLIELRR